MTTRAIVCVLFMGMMLVAPAIVKGENSEPKCGIGAVVAPDSGPANTEILILDHIEVKQVIPAGPADQAGMRDGDKIVQVNGSKVAGMKFVDVINNLIRGAEGTSVKITVQRKGQTDPVSFTVVRGPVTIKDP